MNQFDVNKFDINKHDSMVIEASAGTGKTYTICDILEKMDKCGVDLEKVLIVTFTEKATGELRERIRDRLGRDVSSLNIFTIHSFCQNAISEFGVLLGQPLELNVINECFYLRDFFDQYVRCGEILEDISIFNQKGISVDGFKGYFLDVFNKYYLDSSFKVDPLVVSIKENKLLMMLFNAYLKGLNLFDYLYENYEGFKDNYEAFSNSSNQKCKDFALNIKENDLLYSGNFKKNNKDLNNYPYELEFFYDLKEIANNLKDKSSHIYYQYLIIKYIDDFYKKWHFEKLKNKNQTCNDMIRVVREGVEHNPKFLNKLKEKYEYGIIDEFQDTNELQFNIFKDIFMDDKHKLVVVGDPKQSIYAFQGADVSVYLKARQIIEKEGNVFSLNKNYRSSPKMVESVNKFFKDDNDGNKFFKGIDFLECESGKTKCALYYDEKTGEFSDCPALWLSFGNGGVTKEEYSRAVVNFIVTSCEKVNGRTRLQVFEKEEDKVSKVGNVKFSDFTILAKSRSEFSLVERELKRAGVPFVKNKDANLFLGKECYDYITLISAINEESLTGTARSIYKKTLFTKFFDVPLKVINSSYSERDDTLEMELLTKWKLLKKEKKWEELFDSVIEDSGLLNKLLDSTKLQSLSKYKQIGDFCISYLYNNHTLSDLIRELKNQSQKDSDDDSDSIVEVGTDFDSVNLMTIHASKGLQFKVVISVSGFNPPISQRNIKSVIYHNNGKRMISFDKDDAISDDIEEWKRLMYVCYTRSEYMLFAPYPIEVKRGKNQDNYYNRILREQTLKYMQANPSDFREYSLDSYDYKKIKKSVFSILKVSPIKNNQTKESQLKEIAKLSKRKNDFKTFKHSYSSLSHSKPDLLESDILNKEGEDILDVSEFDLKAKGIETHLNNDMERSPAPDKFPKGKFIGTALHEVFEELDYSNYSEKLNRVIDRCLSRNGVGLDDLGKEYIIEMVNHTLKAKLPIIHGNNRASGEFSLNEIKECDKNNEADFNFNLEGEKFHNYFNGSIDLVFRKDGYYSILDWKSDSLDNSDLLSYSDYDSLKNHTTNHYSIQRVLYSYCLIKWLKQVYPNLSEEEIFNEHFGGVYYVYLRGTYESTGNGIYAQTWESFKELKEAFEKIEKEIGG